MRTSFVFFLKLENIHHQFHEKISNKYNSGRSFLPLDLAGSCRKDAEKSPNLAGKHGKYLEHGNSIPVQNTASNFLVFFVASRPFPAVRHSPGKFRNIHQIIIREGRKEKETTLSNCFCDYFFSSKQRKENGLFPVMGIFPNTPLLYIRRKRCLLDS